MKKTIQFGLIACGGFLLASCGKEVKDVGQRIEMPALMATWSSKCSGGEVAGIGASARTLYKYAGSDVKQVYETHNKGTCQEPLTRVTHEGEFTFKGDSAVSPGAKNVDYQFKKVTVVAMSVDGKKLLDAGFCGIKNWTVNVPVDVTAKAGAADCPVTAAPRLEFDVVKVDNDAVYFGKSKLFEDRSKPSERPAKLNMDKPYYKSDVKID